METGEPVIILANFKMISKNFTILLFLHYFDQVDQSLLSIRNTLISYKPQW